ncbi:MAG TPA: hypothetical protein ENK60_06065 [Anaerolineae bacterium]|nr:hypothetical protein [Anaerolineae bacterium]
MNHHQDEIDALMRRIVDLSDESLVLLSQYISFLKWQEEQWHSPELWEDVRDEEVVWVYDLIDHFSESRQAATVDMKGMEVKVAAASCEGLIRPAIWQHPPVAGEGVIEYQVDTPLELDALKFKFAAGVRDGALLSEDNQVAFRIRVNGRLIWSHLKKEAGWDDFLIDLPTLTGQTMVIQLITDALGNSRWNWAVWGEPRILGLLRT